MRDEYKVGFIEAWLAEAAEDAGLAEQARNNSKVDFEHSQKLRVVLADALWRYETASDQVRATARQMDDATLVRMALDFGLFERLRGEQAS